MREVATVSGSQLTVHRFFTVLTSAVFGVIMALLGLRFVFRLFGASANAPFTDWLYDTTGALMAPFRGIFPSPTTEGGFILDLPALVALLIYGLLAALLVYLFNLFLAPTDKEVVYESPSRKQRFE